MQSNYEFVNHQDNSITVFGPHGFYLDIPAGEEADRFREFLAEWGTPWDVSGAVSRYLESTEEVEVGRTN